MRILINKSYDLKSKIHTTAITENDEFSRKMLLSDKDVNKQNWHLGQEKSACCGKKPIKSHCLVRIKNFVTFGDVVTVNAEC